ncbi:MAG: ActS/PrrB/RegB family redox-sensitive histidine kinase [Paracoccaceae bacterium]|nr:ActS/PrrB/RegB family redox-sensitive histidine kinase [Paracoccaceae bacterium]
MPDLEVDILTTGHRSEWVRLRTLINLRWLAIIGQTGAVLVATTWLDLSINVGMSIMAIGASVVFNIASTIIYPKNKRLSEQETMLALLFDMSQLVFLLYLTGGLNNPFALLILAPVTISATSLTLRSTVALGAVAVILITILAWNYEPLQTVEGEILKMPDIFVTGFWISLIIGLVFLAGYARRVTTETESMSQALIATQMALSREQKLTDLGRVVAAAAHELGTPLATIKLVSTELLDELEDCPQMKEDIQLIGQQADRCRDILRDMGRTGKDDMLIHHAPISSVVREAAEPHENRGKQLHFSFTPKSLSAGEQPSIQRKPEIIHGLRNLIQNAVDFAQENIWIDVIWSKKSIRIVIADDGRGYPPDLIGRIGDPFVSKRRKRKPDPERPEYEGMGLGLFIAKTLLERTGAEITFANGSDPFLTVDETPARRGAIVEVIWPREAIVPSEEVTHGPLGKNAPMRV